MSVFGQWAIFWIVVTNAVANSTRNENETANGVYKSSRIVFPSSAEEKRFRQRWHNLTLASKLKSASGNAAAAANDSSAEAKESKNIIAEIVRQTQHPVKKQLKYKRLRYLSSADQNNGTKLAPAMASPDKSKNDTKASKPTFKSTDSDSFRRPQSDGTGSPSLAAKPPAGSASADSTPSSAQRAATTNGVPSHRKKRRRPQTSASIVVPLAMNAYEPHQVPPQRNAFLDFGKKISVTSSSFARTPHANAIESVRSRARFGVASATDAARLGVASAADAARLGVAADAARLGVASAADAARLGVAADAARLGVASAADAARLGVAADAARLGVASAAEEPDTDKTDRLFVAGSSVHSLYRGSVTKPTTAAILNVSCAPNLGGSGPPRMRAAAKNSEGEVNGCGPANITTASGEESDGSRAKVEDPVRVTEVTPATPASTVASASPTTANPSAYQLTTKILSTAVITSVSIKSNERVTRQKVVTVTPSTTGEARPASSFELPSDHRKITSSSRPFELRISGGSRDYTERNLERAYTAAMPQARYANLSKQYATITRNAVPPYSRLVLSATSAAPSPNVTLATTAESTTSSADPNMQYLVHSIGTSEAEGAPETTTVAWSRRNTTDAAMEKRPQMSSSSTPLFVTYDGLGKDAAEVLVYRVRNESAPGSAGGSADSSSPGSSGGSSSSDSSGSSSLDSSAGDPTTAISTKNAARPNDTAGNPALGVISEGNGGSEEPQDEDGQAGFRIVTYVLAGLGAIPLVIGIALVTKMLLSQNKKQIFEGSEYSSEYNRNTLEFNAGVTSSPIATKLPRVSHQSHWEIEKKSTPSISVPNNSQWEFPRNKLRLQTILGQGNFGQVWKAEADDINGHEGLTRLVAVKMVKEISSTREKEDLIKELIIMQHLGTHPNVVTLLGCCTEKEPYMLIMEYVMYGKLLSFLRDHRTRTHYFNFSDNGDTLTSRDLTVFAYCVARGMEYLQNKQVIHRDLAARNILIDHNKLCKIADFGMSRYVEESGQVYEHRQSKGALPIRWMAPESLQYSCYNHKTDVWSFGILMWEIVTLGSMPYASMGARLVMRKVKEGYRLEKPKYCKTQLFGVISKCWHADPNKRPTFTELKQELYELLENPEHLGNLVDLEALAEDMNQVVHGGHNEKFII